MLAILQIFYLPGAVFARFSSIRVTPLSYFLVVGPLSLLLNHAITLLLTPGGFNHRPEWFAVAALEAALLVFVPTGRPRDFFRTDPKRFAGIERVFCGLAILASLYFLTRWMKSWGTVIHWTDTALSWNRWALEWAASTLPTISRFYPQMVAMVLSIPYQFTGQTEVEFFSLSAVTGIPFLAVGAMVSAFPFYPEKRASLSVACIAFIYFLNRISVPFSGYADAPLAAVVMIVLLFLMLAEPQEEADRDRPIVIGGLLAGLAAVTKQLGVLMIPLFPLLFLLSGRPRAGRSAFIKSAALSVVIAGSWYGIKVYDLITSRDQFGLPGIVETVPLGLLERIPGAIERLDQYLIPGWATRPLRLAAYGLLVLLAGVSVRREKKALIHLLIALAGTVFWILVASYDSRNLSLVVPFLALLLGGAANGSGAGTVESAKKRGSFRTGYAWVFFAVLALAGQMFLPDGVLIRQQKAGREEWIKAGAAFLPEAPGVKH